MLLIFLLGVAPVQSVLADVIVPADNKNMPCHEMSGSSQADMMSKQSTNHCDQCESASNCRSHCMSSMLGLLVQYIPMGDFGSRSVSSLVSVDVKTQQPPALYRPPRS
jgi:hypothetical protein